MAPRAATWMYFSLAPFAPVGSSTWLIRKRSPVVSPPLSCGAMRRCKVPPLSVASSGGRSSGQVNEKSYSTAVKKVWRALKMVILEPKIFTPTQK